MSLVPEGVTLHDLILERGSRRELLEQAQWLREIANGHQVKADRYEEMARECCKRAAERKD